MAASLSPTEQALMRSQSGPMAGLPFSCIPSSNLFVFTPEVFRVLLFRRVWLPLPPGSRNCRCGRPFDVLGHQQLAREQESSVGVRPWSLLPLRFVVKLVVASATSICQWPGLTVVALRWWLMDFPCLGQPNLRWTPRWYLQ